MSRRRTVLVVDDSRAPRERLSRALRGAGYEVLEAGDGAEGAVAAFQASPDAVVTDLEMPTLDGVPLLRLLKADPSTASLPVVILTGQRGAESRFWGLKTGADAYLTKDDPPGQVVDVLGELLDGRPPSSGRDGAPPRGPLEVLARVARQLDRSLLQTTLANAVLEQGVASETLEEAGERVLDTLSEVVDSLLLAVAVGEHDMAHVHLLLQEPSGDTVVAEVIDRLLEEMHLPRDTKLDLHVRGSCNDGMAPTDLLDLALFPLSLREANGVLAVLPRHADHFQRVSSQLVRSLLGHLTLVLDNSRLYHKLRERSTTDSLTRLPNHRAILDRLSYECERAMRHDHPLTILLVDLDHFKRVNDSHGHLAGDRVLRVVSHNLRERMRCVDALGRYGGEELVGVMPETDLAGGRIAAERLRTELSVLPITLPGGETIHITGSFGLAALDELPGERTEDQLLSLADTRLYEAKAAGRNCVRP